MNNQNIVSALDPLFNPRSIAIIGATNDMNKWGYFTIASALDGFKGTIYPVNIREDQVLGRRAYPRVTDIPDNEPVDLAIIVIPAQNVASVMKDCVTKGVRATVIITAGFAEVGEEGKRLQDEVVRIAKKGGIRIVGPNCMGFWSASSDLRAFMFPLQVKEGPIAFVSQGGNIGGAIIGAAFSRGIGFQRYVSCGCTADIQIEDYIEHFGHDPEVKVILTYIEGLNDGNRFIEKVREVTKKKPVIAMKPGKTEAAAKAITSHSGALSGSTSVYASAFRKAGVISAETSEELLDYAIGFLLQPLPKGNRVAIATPGGSYGVLCADACAMLGLDVIDLPEETIAAFDKIFPPRWSRGNPVDPAGDRDFPAYFKAGDMLLDLPIVDAIIFMGFGDLTNMEEVFPDLYLLKNGEKVGSDSKSIQGDLFNIGSNFPDQIYGWIKKYEKPVLTTTFTNEIPRLEEGIHHAYPSPFRAARVLAKLVEYKSYLTTRQDYKEGDLDPFQYWWIGDHVMKGAARKT